MTADLYFPNLEFALSGDYYSYGQEAMYYYAAEGSNSSTQIPRTFSNYYNFQALPPKMHLNMAPLPTKSLSSPFVYQQRHLGSQTNHRRNPSARIHQRKPSVRRPMNDNTSQSTLPQTLFLTCLKVGCSAMFRSVETWESHCSSCLLQESESWVQCPFISCAAIFSSTGSLHNHYAQRHLLFACRSSGCNLCFDQEEDVNTHASFVHGNTFLTGRVSDQYLSLEVKDWSILDLQNGVVFNRSSCIPFDSCFKQASVTEFGAEMERSVSSCSASSMDQPSTPGSYSPISEPNIPIMGSPDDLPRLELPRASVTYPPLRLPQLQTTGRSAKHSQTPSFPVTTLTWAEQKHFYIALHSTCVNAAYAFYNKHGLRAAYDKKSVPVFLTKDKQVAQLPSDLTLPQWTQHLRKACDTRHIEEHMVSSHESFKGEIQPVDEVRHALVKEKVKCDRALLALIWAARIFVDQLMDQERCDFIDGLYDEVERAIEEKKIAVSKLDTAKKMVEEKNFGLSLETEDMEDNLKSAVSEKTVRRFTFQ